MIHCSNVSRIGMELLFQYVKESLPAIRLKCYFSKLVIFQGNFQYQYEKDVKKGGKRINGLANLFCDVKEVCMFCLFSIFIVQLFSPSLHFEEIYVQQETYGILVSSTSSKGTESLTSLRELRYGSMIKTDRNYAD